MHELAMVRVGNRCVDRLIFNMLYLDFEFKIKFLFSRFKILNTTSNKPKVIQNKIFIFPVQIFGYKQPKVSPLTFPFSSPVRSLVIQQEVFVSHSTYILIKAGIY